MASGLNEVQASVNTVIDDFSPVDAILLFEIGVKAGFNVFNNRLPTRNRICDVESR